MSQEDDDIFVFGQPITSTVCDDVDFQDFRAKTTEASVTVTEDAKKKTILAKETDAARHKVVPIGIARAIAKGRLVVRMTQKQLSTRLNMDNKHLAAIESGTAIYNTSELHRIRIFLGLPKWDGHP
jgi:ribosome-binding protein aMBF1 (putative translation factor)